MASRIEADVTCPVCLELFQDPVLLRCLHTLCAQCSRLPAVQIDPCTVQCPTCRHNTATADVTNDFKTKNWVDLYQQLKSQEDAMEASAPPVEAPPPYTAQAVHNAAHATNPIAQATQSTAQATHGTPYATQSTAQATQSTAQATQNTAYATQNIGQITIPPSGEQSKMPQPLGFEPMAGGFGSKAEEAAASASTPYAPQFQAPAGAGGMGAPVSSMYPSLPPPSYTETIQPEVVDESSLKHFINVDLQPEEVFKFRGKALTIRAVQQKAWVVLADGGIKVFSRTGYQFGKYVCSDLQVHQHASALWSVVPFQGGSDKYVYRASAVTEAHNGDIIAACHGSNSWSVLPSFSRFKLDRAFDSVGLVHMSNIGTVQVIISSKHYTDVRSHGQLLYALPISKSMKKVEVYHHDNNKWLLQRTIQVQPGVMRIVLGQHWMFTSNTRSTTGDTYVCKYDLSENPKTTDKYVQYPHKVVDFAQGSKPQACCVDPHGNSIIADSKNDCLVLVDRQLTHTPLRVKGRFRPTDMMMENTKTLLMLTENENGIAKLIHLGKM